MTGLLSSGRYNLAALYINTNFQRERHTLRAKQA